MSDDFAPAWSDVDVCVALREDVDQATGSALRAAAARLHDRFVVRGESGWGSGQFVEASYLKAEVLVETGEGEVLRPFDRDHLARFGRTIAGRKIAVRPPGREALRRQLGEDLAMLENPATDRPIWLAAMLHWMARSLAFWRDGLRLGKTAALEREIEAGSRFAEAFRLALRLRRQGSVQCAAHHGALRTAFERTAPGVAAILSAPEAH